ncbi:MAG: hypothetical protein V4714_15960 [Bacteroidota bacterium]
MKKHLLQLLLFIMIPLSSIAQVDITLGTPYQVVDAFQKKYFYEGDKILSIKVMRTNIFLQKFDANSLSLIKVTAYKDLPKNSVVEKIAKFANRYYIFYSLWDKKDEVEQLFSREIDFKSGVFINAGKLILKIEQKLTSSETSFESGSVTSYNIDKFNFYTSNDTSKIFIQSRLKPNTKNDSKSYDIININVFNQNFDPIWNQEIKMPYTEKKMNNIDYSVDYEGNAYILSMVYDDNTTDIKKNKDATPNYHLELLRVKANTNHIDITPIEVADKFINKIGLYEHPMHYMICAGFYSNGKVLDNINGVILFKIEKEGKYSDINTYAIDKDQSAFKNLDLTEVIIEKDGSLLLIGEQYYVTEHHSSSANGRTIIDYISHYDDMLLTKIDNVGKLSWMKRLSKRQMGGGQENKGYKYIREENNYNILFFDNSGLLNKYTINNIKGDVIKTSILNPNNIKGIQLFQYGEYKILTIAPSTFVFESYKKNKEDILIKVNLSK